MYLPLDAVQTADRPKIAQAGTVGGCRQQYRLCDDSRSLGRKNPGDGDKRRNLLRFKRIHETLLFLQGGGITDFSP